MTQEQHELLHQCHLDEHEPKPQCSKVHCYLASTFHLQAAPFEPPQGVQDECAAKEERLDQCGDKNDESDWFDGVEIPAGARLGAEDVADAVKLEKEWLVVCHRGDVVLVSSNEFPLPVLSHRLEVTVECVVSCRTRCVEKFCIW